MNWYLDVFAYDYMSDNTLAELQVIERLEKEFALPAVNEDDCESFAPYVGILPDESDHENGSPLDFGGARRYGEGKAVSPLPLPCEE